MMIMIIIQIHSPSHKTTAGLKAHEIFLTLVNAFINVSTGFVAALPYYILEGILYKYSNITSSNS